LTGKNNKFLKKAYGTVFTFRGQVPFKGIGIFSPGPVVGMFVPCAIPGNELLKTDHVYLVAVVSCNALHFLLIYLQDTDSNDLNVFFRIFLLTIYGGFLHRLTPGR